MHPDVTSAAAAERTIRLLREAQESRARAAALRGCLSVVATWTEDVRRTLVAR